MNTKSAVDETFVDIGAYGGLDVATSGTTFETLGFDEALIKASGTVDLDIAGFVQIEDVSFAFEKKELTDVDLDTISGPATALASANLVTIGLDGGTAFVGINGGTSQAIGFSATIDSLAVALIKPTLASDTRSWTALRASVSSAAFVAPAGLPLTIAATDLTIELNTKSPVDQTFVDFGECGWR